MGGVPIKTYRLSALGEATGNPEGDMVTPCTDPNMVNCFLQGDVHQESGADPAGGGGEGEEAHLRRGSAPSPRQRPLLRLGEGRAGPVEHYALLQVARPFGEQIHQHNFYISAN